MKYKISPEFSFPIFHCYWYASLIQALAGGNLLYLAVFEILQREKCKEKVPGMLQLFCVIIGFLVIMCLDITGYGKIMIFHYRLGNWNNLDWMCTAYSICLLFLFLVPHDHEHEHGHEGHEHHISAANESENTTVPIDW